MSLFDSDIAVKAENQAIRDNLARLHRINESADSSEPQRSKGTLEPRRRIAERFVYRPSGYLQTDSFRSERIARADVKVRKANATYRDQELKRLAQNGRAGKR